MTCKYRSATRLIILAALPGPHSALSAGSQGLAFVLAADTGYQVCHWEGSILMRTTRLKANIASHGAFSKAFARNTIEQTNTATSMGKEHCPLSDFNLPLTIQLIFYETLMHSHTGV